jgi:hypothetical protein
MPSVTRYESFPVAVDSDCTEMLNPPAREVEVQVMGTAVSIQQEALSSFTAEDESGREPEEAERLTVDEGSDVEDVRIAVVVEERLRLSMTMAWAVRWTRKTIE